MRAWRPFLLLLLLPACGETYPCCRDGLLAECTCPAGDLCMRERFQDNGDGTCDADPEVADTADTAE